jgi:hypothetical protein
METADDHADEFRESRFVLTIWGGLKSNNVQKVV